MADMFRIFIILLFAIASLPVVATPKTFLTPNTVLEIESIEVAKNIYVVHGINQSPTPENKGLIANLGFVVNDSGVIVIESGASQKHGGLLVKAIEKTTSLPIIAVFNTHQHGDHWLGNNAIRKRFPAAKFYANKTMVETAQSTVGDDWVTLLNSLTDGAITGTQPFPPSYPLANNDILNFGNVTIKIHSNDAAHTGTDIIVSIEQNSTKHAVFLGDVGLHQRIGRMDDGNFKGNIEALDNAITLQADVYVPGHGPTTLGSSSAQLYRDYLSLLYEQTERWYEEGLTDFEIKDKIRPAFKQWEHWEGFNEEFGRHVSLIYLEIEEASF
jgi:glyoxylase-like metal-dependent hydrolase (beta-lactamase superfamily II)